MLDKQKNIIHNQYFPTCHFKERDIALEEYKACCQVLESEEKFFDSLIKYVTSFGTIVVSLLIGSLKIIEANYSIIERQYIFICAAIMVFILSWIIIETFGERQKSIVLAKRKIVILRRMLGLSYQNQEFLFPKYHFEGSSEPFEIRLKFDYRIIIILFLFAITWISLGYYCFTIECINYIICVIILIILLFLYRYLMRIKDIHENIFFIIATKIFSFFGLKFVKNTGYVFYRAKLSAVECERNEIKLKTLKRFAILIEDSRYYKHKGIDLKAIARAIFSRFKQIPLLASLNKIQRLALSGGSTITQQLFRTLFIEEMNKRKIRRKIAEILFSRFWLNKMLSKENQLEIYLNSVRFDSNAFGVIPAMKYFFKMIENNPSNAQSFFLIERISVVSNKILPKTINLIKRFKYQKILDNNDIKELILIYKQCMNDGKIESDEKMINELDNIENDKTK